MKACTKTEYYFFLADSYVEGKKEGETIFVDRWAYDRDILVAIIASWTDLTMTACEIIADELINNEECYYTQRVSRISA